MGFETPGQQCLPNWEIGQTTVDGCLLAGVSSNLGGNVFPLEELGIGMQTDSQTPTSFASSKTVFLQMSRKPGDSEPASEENKQLDPGGEEGSHRFEKQMYCFVLFCFLGKLCAWMPGLCLVFFSVYLFCVCFVLFFTTGKPGDGHFLRAEQSMGGEKKTNGDANRVDEERNRSASIFLPINPLKINTFRFGSIATRWDRIVTRFSHN